MWNQSELVITLLQASTDFLTARLMNFPFTAVRSRSRKSKQFSLPEAAKGAVLIEVPQNSPGAAQGLRAGDLVVAVGRAAVANPEDVPGLVAGAKKAGHKNILLRVEREGNSRFVALPVEAG